MSLGPRLTCLFLHLLAVGLGAISPGERWQGGGWLASQRQASGARGHWWPLALRSGTAWTVAQHLCVWGELAWQQWWEIQFPAHLGGSCVAAFLARLAEPARAENAWALCPLPAVQLGTGFLVVFGAQGGRQPPPVLPAGALFVDRACEVILHPLWTWHVADKSPGSMSWSCCLSGQVIHLSEPHFHHL